jgi:hypothetical protein
VSEPALAVVAQGAKRTVLSDSVFAYGAGQYLIVSVDLPVTAHVTHASREQPFLAVGMTLKPAAIAALLLESGPGDQERRSRSGSRRAMRPPNCSTRSCACCGCSIIRATGARWAPRWSARSSGG